MREIRDNIFAPGCFSHSSLFSYFSRLGTLVLPTLLGELSLSEQDNFKAAIGSGPLNRLSAGPLCFVSETGSTFFLFTFVFFKLRSSFFAGHMVDNVSSQHQASDFSLNLIGAQLVIDLS